MKRYILIILCVMMVFSSATVAVAGDSISDMQNKIKENEQKVKDINDKLGKIKNEKISVQAEVNKLDLEADKLNLEINGYELQIQGLNSEIKTKEGEIVKLKEDISHNNDMLEERLRIMYKKGVGGYVDVIFESEDLIDALTRLDMIQLIVKSDVDLLKSIEQQKAEVETKQVELETERTQVVAVQSNLTAKKNEVVASWRAKEKYMSSLENNAKELQDMESRMNQESKKLENLILEKQREVEYAGGVMLWPVPGHMRITSHFGNREHPITGVWGGHGGTDIAAPYNSKVVAANDGVVLFAGWSNSYGYYVIIDHGGGIATLYGHNTSLLVSSGQSVNRGQQIAKSGSTGESTGPHVHFEVRINGVRVDAEPYLK